MTPTFDSRDQHTTRFNMSLSKSPSSFDTMDAVLRSFNIECPVSTPSLSHSRECNKFWCSLCSVHSVYQKRTEWSCDNCGQIVDAPIDETAEWNFTTDDTKQVSRCGLPMNPNFPKSSLGSIVSNKRNGKGGRLGKRNENTVMAELTTIDPFPLSHVNASPQNSSDQPIVHGDANTYHANPAESAEYRMRRIQRFQSWNTSNYRERSLFKDFETIQSIASYAGLLMVVQRGAMNLFSKVKKAHICRGDAKKGIVAASIFFACKQKGVPRSARETASFFRDEKITEKIVIKGCKRFEEIWSSMGESPIIEPSTLTAPSDFVERFLSRLSIHSTHFSEVVIDLTDFIYEHSFLTDSVPQNVAVAALILLKDECEVQLPSLEDTYKLTMTSYSGTKKCLRKLTLLPIFNT